mmetsp:Transcript_50678/g.120693  ORF Transcript_50678/g.120693 Transcript_50678/m.120693 type:complete len:233 (-) Transcript_50678:7-705(-)
MSRAVSARPKSAREPKDGWGLQDSSGKAVKKQDSTLDLEEDLHLTTFILSNTTRKFAHFEDRLPRSYKGVKIQASFCRDVFLHVAPPGGGHVHCEDFTATYRDTMAWLVGNIRATALAILDRPAPRALPAFEESAQYPKNLKPETAYSPPVACTCADPSRCRRSDHLRSQPSKDSPAFMPSLMEEPARFVALPVPVPPKLEDIGTYAPPAVKEVGAFETSVHFPSMKGASSP